MTLCSPTRDYLPFSLRGTPRRAAISQTDDAQSSGHGGGVLRKSIKREDSPALSSNRGQ
jgi:hypothetical protein